ncbi:MAG: PD-(D/E)XK nuclease family protein, partial [Gammaproteobacteria bacterium]|nr:PD-(D/E)XK nuclease family protein [Gammaproteobacteria bacterium]
RQYLYISGCSKVSTGTNTAKATKESKNKLGWYGLIQKHWPDQDLTIKKSALSLKPQPILKAMSPDASYSQISVQFSPKLFFFDQQQQNELDKLDKSNETVEPEIEDDKAQQRGTVIHRAIELLSSNNPENNNEIAEQLAAEFSLNIQSTYFNELFTEAQRTIAHTEFAPVFDIQQFEKAFNEIPIQIKSDRGLQHGIVDRLIVSGNNITIVDYKTHSSGISNKPTDLETIAESYRPQMQLYANAVSQLWPGASIKKLILFTHHLESIVLE